VEPELAEWLVSVRDDPYAFVMGALSLAYAWDPTRGLRWADALGKAQMERIRLGLLTIDGAILEATASGHGIAKSTTVAQLVLWAFITFPDCRGVVTAILRSS